MKATHINIIKFMLLAGLAFAQVACDNVVFSQNGQKQKPIGPSGGDNPDNPDDPDDPDEPGIPDFVFLDDSFERNDIPFDIDTATFYGWRGHIIDHGVDVLGFQSQGAGARIPKAEEFGPAAHGERFLLFTGRQDAPYEITHLVSQSYDLSLYNSVILNFRYLTFQLNDANDINDGPETLKLEVCRGTLNECGANDDALSAVGLKSDKWITVFTNDQNINDDNFNGQNHNLNDWNNGLVVIDLRDPNLVGNGSTFVFRFRTAMDAGLIKGKVCPNPDANQSSEKVTKYEKTTSHSQTIIAGSHIFLKDIVGTRLENVYAEQFACDSGKTGSKVKICHIPPGNPKAKHTICIGRAALKAHAKHQHGNISDYYGDCKKSCNGGGGDDDGGDDDDGDDDDGDDDDGDDDDGDDDDDDDTCKPTADKLADGIAVDAVKGTATVKTIEELF